ncbi:hypothetical protein V6N13_110890 [Hibiscus sabdariffa]
MEATVPGDYGSSMEPLFERRLSGGCFRLRARVSLLGSQAALKLTPARRAHPSKVIWCLVFVVNVFMALGVNDGTLGAVANGSDIDPGVRRPLSTLKLHSYYCCFSGFHVDFAYVVLSFVSMSLWCSVVQSMRPCFVCFWLFE